MKHELQNRNISLPIAIVPVHHMCSVTNKHELVTWISYAPCISLVLYVFTTTGMQAKILCNNVCVCTSHTVNVQVHNCTHMHVQILN